MVDDFANGEADLVGAAQRPALARDTFLNVLQIPLGLFGGRRLLDWLLS